MQHATPNGGSEEPGEEKQGRRSAPENRKPFVPKTRRERDMVKLHRFEQLEKDWKRKAKSSAAARETKRKVNSNHEFTCQGQRQDKDRGTSSFLSACKRRSLETAERCT